MSIDLNQAEEQKDFGCPIPPGSAVKVRLSLRHPKAGKEGSSTGVTRAESGFEYLDCEMEVLAGTFKGKQIWENLGVAGVGKEKAVQIAMRTLRAIVESSRNILPTDQSPNGIAARRMNAWTDMNGMEFAIVVGCQKVKPGDRYVNNNIKRVITPEHELYSEIMAGGERISQEPIPEIPTAAGQSPTPSWGAPKPAAPPVQGSLPTPAKTWSGPPQSAPAPAVQTPVPGATPPGAPSWAH